MKNRRCRGVPGGLGPLTQSARQAPSKDDKRLIDRKTVAEVPLTGLSLPRILPSLAGRSVLECISSGTHAGVRAYAVTTHNHGEPVFENETSWFPQKRWGVELLHQAALRAMKQLADQRLMPGATDAPSLLLECIHRPDHDEALTVGRWPVHDLQNRSSSNPLADPPTWTRIVSALLSGQDLPRTLWQAGERELMGVRRHLAYRAIRRLSSRPSL